MNLISKYMKCTPTKHHIYNGCKENQKFSKINTKIKKSDFKIHPKSTLQTFRDEKGSARAKLLDRQKIVWSKNLLAIFCLATTNHERHPDDIRTIPERP